MEYVTLVPEDMLKRLFEYFSEHTKLSWVGLGEPLFGRPRYMYEARENYYFDKKNGLYAIMIYNEDHIRYEDYIRYEGTIEGDLLTVLGFNEMFNKETYNKIGVEWHE